MGLRVPGQIDMAMGVPDQIGMDVHDPGPVTLAHLCAQNEFGHKGGLSFPGARMGWLDRSWMRGRTLQYTPVPMHA
jgi:hypothetical protein